MEFDSRGSIRMKREDLQEQKMTMEETKQKGKESRGKDKMEEEDSFAARILKKHGWISGQGLGKNNNGIIKPLYTTTQKTQEGIGFSPNDYHSWWDDLYNKTIVAIQDDKSENNEKETERERKRSRERDEKKMEKPLIMDGHRKKRIKLVKSTKKKVHESKKKQK